MISTNEQLRQEALVSLKGKWKLAIVTFFVFSIVSFILTNGNSRYLNLFNTNPIASGSLTLSSIILTGPLLLGIITFSLNISRGLDAHFEQLFNGFNDFIRSLGVYLLALLSVVAGTMCLIIPGIIVFLMFSQAFYILADNKEISVIDTLRESERIMKGYKLKYLGLCLRFIPLIILSIVTLGIGFLWLIPYMHISSAKFYDNIKANPIEIE
ncbi:MAG: DUF975 family protein [Marinifilaceae bacterium]